MVATTDEVVSAEAVVMTVFSLDATESKLKMKSWRQQPKKLPWTNKQSL